MSSNRPEPAVTLPGLYIPFKSARNTGLVQLKYHLESWADRHDLVRGSAARRQMRSAHFEKLIASAYPTADTFELFLVGETILWMFLYDDQFDLGRLGSDPRNAIASAERVDAILHDGRLMSRGSPDPLMKSLSALRDRWREALPGSLFQRLMQDIKTFTWSVAQEVEERKSRKTHGLDSYFELRMRTFAWAAVADLIEVAQRMELPESIRDSREYLSLFHSAGKVMCGVNDIFSFSKEVRSGETHNIAFVFMEQRNCTPQEALGFTRDLIGRFVEDFELGVKALSAVEVNSALDGPTCTEINAWVGGLRYLMSGQLDWYTESSRYRT